MTRKGFVTVFLLGSLILLINGCALPKADEDASPTGVGGDVRSVLSTGVGATQREALEDAGRAAISLVVGELIVAETVVLNDRLTKDEILTASAGIVENIELISTNRLDDGSVQVKASVAVSKRRINKELARRNIALSGLDSTLMSEMAALQGVRVGQRAAYYEVLTKLLAKPIVEEKTAYRAEVVAIHVMDDDRHCWYNGGLGCLKVLAPGGRGNTLPYWRSLDEKGGLVEVLISFRIALAKEYLDNVRFLFEETEATGESDRWFGIAKVGLKYKQNGYACGGFARICTQHLLGGPSHSYALRSWQARMVSRMLTRIARETEDARIQIRARDASGRVLRKYSYHASGQGITPGSYIREESTGPAGRRIAWTLPSYRSWPKTFFTAAELESLGDTNVYSPSGMKDAIAGVYKHGFSLLDNGDTLFTATVLLPYQEVETVDAFEVAYVY